MSGEPTIVINGHTLTWAQALAVRVAVADFTVALERDGALGTDAHGREMRLGYLRALREVLEFTMGPPK